MDTAAPESVRQLIRKIHALSLRGVGGEAEAASHKLGALLKKYHITLDDVVNDVVQTYDFRYKTALEAKLIIQCYVSLGVESPNILEYKRGKRQLPILGLDLTPSQYVDLQGMLAYYKAALKKETERLFSAFIQRHKLYAPPSGEAKDTLISSEEMDQLMAMMRVLGEKSYVKPAGLLV